MSTEMLIISILGAFIAIGVFYNSETSPKAAFMDAGPTLGLRLERNLETGAGFTDASLQPNRTDSPISWSSE